MDSDRSSIHNSPVGTFEFQRGEQRSTLDTLLSMLGLFCRVLLMFLWQTGVQGRSGGSTQARSFGTVWLMGQIPASEKAWQISDSDLREASPLTQDRTRT